MSTDTQYERIRADEIEPGDFVARARTHTFREVTGVRYGDSAMWIEYTTGGRDRPRRDAQWWRVVSGRSAS